MPRFVWVVLLLVGVATASCSDSDGEPAAEPTIEATSPPEETPRPAPTALAALAETLVVPASANIFGAGRTDPPAPGAGGAGTLPPGWRLPAGATRVVTFTNVLGKVNFSSGNAYDNVNGPAGDNLRKTDVQSYQGISGIIHRRNGSFLVGVFLTDAPPKDPAPPRLNVTQPPAGDSIAPRIAQVFLIGDGKTYRYTDDVGTGQPYRFIVPPAATRVYVGFADAAFWQGPPGWYGNNTGELTVNVDVATG